MELGHAYSVLVVSASAKFNESVRGLLPERFYWPVTVLTDAAGARRELLENSYDLVVINTRSTRRCRMSSAPDWRRISASTAPPGYCCW